MYRGTTPTIILNIKNEDLDMSLIRLYHVTLKSEGGLVKEIFDNIHVDEENSRIYFTMSQEDTMAFSVGKIKLQLRVRLNNDMVVASKIIVTNMKELLEGTIL